MLSNAGSVVTTGSPGQKKVLCLTWPVTIRTALWGGRTHANNQHLSYACARGPAGQRFLRALRLRLRARPTKRQDPNDGAAFKEKFSVQHSPSGDPFPPTSGGTKKQPDACFKNKLCKRKKQNIICLFPSCLKYLKQGDLKLSGIGRALRFVSTFGVRNKGTGVCSLKLSHSIWDCHNNRHVFPSNGKVRLGPTRNNSTAHLDPTGEALEITQTYRLLYNDYEESICSVAK